MEIEAEMRYSVITQTAGGLLGLGSLVLRYKLRKARKPDFFFRTEKVTGLIGPHSWIMHLCRGDSAALSIGENMLEDETCQKE